MTTDGHRVWVYSYQCLHLGKFRRTETGSPVEAVADQADPPDQPGQPQAPEPGEASEEHADTPAARPIGAGEWLEPSDTR